MMRWKDNSICLGSYLGINESAVFENGHVILVSEVEKGLAVLPPGTFGGIGYYEEDSRVVGLCCF
jgi:hypothetical protein